MEAKVIEALVAELQRQAAEGGLTVETPQEGRLRLNGEADLEAVAAAVVGAVAGGP